jgi:Bacteriophage Mu, Gp27
MLPPHIRKQVERRMLAKRFSDYEGLAEWVRQQGYDISDDSLWRYGKSLKREFTAAQFSLLQARMLAAQAPDHKGRLMQAVIQVVQQKLLSALTQEEEINHAEMPRLVHAVAELGRISFAHQRWTAEVRRRKKARRRREEDALIASDLQELLLDPHDDPELDAELAQSTMDETQVPSAEPEPANLNALPSRPSPDHED